jgi:hypothetical protein
MSFTHVDIEAALRRLAEHRIEDAIKEGKFDHLAGMGEPLHLEPMPAEENARLTWWALRILRQNDFTPHEVRWRKQIDVLRDQLASAHDEPRVRSLVALVNELVHRLNTLGTNALQGTFASLSLDTELERLRSRRVS